MRLTLRTLLAYLDDVLDPADKEELAQKIESSDFARDLVHQTRDSVRRLRVSAPQVIGTGMGMDPNTVAEYLDNALPPEQVGDYERICLESDVHLAETAACHHVLTMVLGEPAEVEPRSRQRMYMIPTEARERRRLRAEPAHARNALATSVAVAAPPMAASVPGTTRTQVPATKGVEVPEYLRTRAWWQSRAVLAALAVVLLVGVGLYFISDRMGVFGGGQEVASVGAGEQTTPKAAPADPKAEAVTTETTPAPTAPETGATAPPVIPPAPLVAPELGSSQPVATAETAATPDVPATVDGSAVQNPTPDANAVPVVEVPPTVGDAAAGTPATASAPTEPAAATVAEAAPIVDPLTDAPPQAAASPETAAATVPPTVPPLEGPPVETLASGVPDGAPPALSVEGSAVDSNPGDETSAVAGPRALGTYLSGQTVLLRYDRPQGGWFRVEPRSAVVAEDRLLSLPEFRPQINLASGAMLDMSGGTQVVLRAGGENGAAAADAGSDSVPLIEVLYGRIIVTNTSNADSQVQIKAGANVGKAELERNTTLAVEVERPYAPGNDPRTTPAPVVAKNFAPNGRVTWTDASGEVVVEKPSLWMVTEGAPVELVADSEPPVWINREPVVRMSEQKYGAPKIEERLTSDRPANIQLLEIFHGNGQRELKSLAAKSCMHVGEFTPFIEALRDSGQRTNWRTHIQALRSAMAQSPESAELVYKALDRSTAADLYEMLCGYNAEQIGATPDERKSGALAKLIGWLENDNLDYRVLAVHNLWEITGKQLMQNPAANETARKQNVRRWRDRLESGELELVKRGE